VAQRRSDWKILLKSLVNSLSLNTLLIHFKDVFFQLFFTFLVKDLFGAISKQVFAARVFK
jgi:hypothetical protein